MEQLSVTVKTVASPDNNDTLLTMTTRNGLKICNRPTKSYEIWKGKRPREDSAKESEEMNIKRRKRSKSSDGPLETCTLLKQTEPNLTSSENLETTESADQTPDPCVQEAVPESLITPQASTATIAPQDYDSGSYRSPRPDSVITGVCKPPSSSSSISFSIVNILNKSQDPSQKVPKNHQLLNANLLSKPYFPLTRCGSGCGSSLSQSDIPTLGEVKSSKEIPHFPENSKIPSFPHPHCTSYSSFRSIDSPCVSMPLYNPSQITTQNTSVEFKIDNIIKQSLAPINISNTYIDRLDHSNSPYWFNMSQPKLPPNFIVKEVLSSEVFPRRIGHPYQNRNPPKRKKPRTSFSRVQICELEKRFLRQKYLASSERANMAHSLKMSDAQVKTWFQNRRTKWRRQTAEERELERQATNKLLMSLQKSSNLDKSFFLSTSSHIPISLESVIEARFKQQPAIHGKGVKGEHCCKYYVTTPSTTDILNPAKSLGPLKCSTPIAEDEFCLEPKMTFSEDCSLRHFSESVSSPDPGSHNSTPSQLCHVTSWDRGGSDEDRSPSDASADLSSATSRFSRRNDQRSREHHEPCCRHHVRSVSPSCSSPSGLLKIQQFCDGTLTQMDSFSPNVRDYGWSPPPPPPLPDINRQSSKETECILPCKGVQKVSLPKKCPTTVSQWSKTCSGTRRDKVPHKFDEEEGGGEVLKKPAPSSSENLTETPPTSKNKKSSTLTCRDPSISIAPSQSDTTKISLWSLEAGLGKPFTNTVWSYPHGHQYPPIDHNPKPMTHPPPLNSIHQRPWFYHPNPYYSPGPLVPTLDFHPEYLGIAPPLYQNFYRYPPAILYDWDAGKGSD